MDVCFDVDIVYYSTGQLMGRWINMGYIKSWYLDKGSIFVRDMAQWEKCLNPDAKCLRYATWEPL